MITEQEFRAKVLERLDNIESTQATIVEQIKEVNIILHGSEKLGVPALHKQVRELWQVYDRAKWAFGALGVTNIGFILLWLFSQLENAMNHLP